MTGEERLDRLVERLTARVNELEAWRAQMALQVVTRDLIVRHSNPGPAVHLWATDDWAELVVQLGEGDRDVRASIIATDELDPPAAYLTLRVDDEDQVELSTLWPGRLAPPAGVRS